MYTLSSKINITEREINLSVGSLYAEENPRNYIPTKNYKIDNSRKTVPINLTDFIYIVYFHLRIFLYYYIWKNRSKLHYYRENKIPNSVKVEASTVQIIFKVHVILHFYEGIVQNEKRQIGYLFTDFFFIVT